MIQYKGYFIFGGAVKIPPNSPAWWRSQGSVFTNTPEGAVLSNNSKASSSNPNKPPKPTAWNSVKSGSTKIRTRSRRCKKWRYLGLFSSFSRSRAGPLIADRKKGGERIKEPGHRPYLAPASIHFFESISPTFSA